MRADRGIRKGAKHVLALEIQATDSTCMGAGQTARPQIHFAKRAGHPPEQKEQEQALATWKPTLTR